MFEDQVMLNKNKLCALSVPFFFLFTQQAIIAICVPGEMTALWTKSGGKTARRVASESAIKRG